MEHATGGAEPQWRKSSHSDFNGNCLEVAVTGDGLRVRDSRNTALGLLAFPGGEWGAFLRPLSGD